MQHQHPPRKQEPSPNLKVIWPYPKHRGKALDTIEDWSYLRWALENSDDIGMKDELFVALRAYLARNGELNND